jgi:hypothetical protein
MHIYKKFISALMLVIVADILLTTAVWAGNETITITDPDLGTTSPNHRVSLTAEITFSIEDTPSNLVHIKLTKLRCVKVKKHSKLILLDRQPDLVLYSHFD